MRCGSATVSFRMDSAGNTQIGAFRSGAQQSLRSVDQSSMERPTISKIFDEVLAGSDTEALLRQVATLPDDERAALLKALRYLEAQAPCAEPGKQIKFILEKFGEGCS